MYYYLVEVPYYIIYKRFETGNRDKDAKDAIAFYKKCTEEYPALVVTLQLFEGKMILNQEGKAG